MASTQSWRNLLSQWMSACLAAAITGASLQLEQLTEALTYKDRSTYMEGWQKTLTLQRVCLLLWSNFSLSEGPRAAGYDGARGTRAATLLWVLLPPAQHLPGAWAWNPNQLLLLQHRHPRRLSSGPQTLPGETMAGGKGADKHTTTPRQDCDPTSQLPSATQNPRPRAGQQRRAEPQGGQQPSLPGLSTSFCLFQGCLEYPGEYGIP